MRNGRSRERPEVVLLLTDGTNGVVESSSVLLRLAVVVFIRLALRLGALVAVFLLSYKQTRVKMDAWSKRILQVHRFPSPSSPVVSFFLTRFTFFLKTLVRKSWNGLFSPSDALKVAASAFSLSCSLAMFSLFISRTSLYSSSFDWRSRNKVQTLNNSLLQVTDSPGRQS